MFIVLLKFSENHNQISEFKDGHMKWLKSGFDAGIFLLAGGMKPHLGGAIIAHNTSLLDLTNRVEEDPFVIEKIVTAEILEVDPTKTDQKLNFLLKD